jgi:hypothetical protein
MAREFEVRNVLTYISDHMLHFDAVNNMTCGVVLLLIRNYFGVSLKR